MAQKLITFEVPSGARSRRQIEDVCLISWTEILHLQPEGTEGARGPAPVCRAERARLGGARGAVAVRVRWSLDAVHPWRSLCPPNTLAPSRCAVCQVFRRSDNETRRARVRHAGSLPSKVFVARSAHRLLPLSQGRSDLHRLEPGSQT